MSLDGGVITLCSSEPLTKHGVVASESLIASLRDMSVGANAQKLYEIGRAFARTQVHATHFPQAFDPGDKLRVQ